MGGSHKKKLRAEKAKVKLKGAKLPKGLNVTKTEFKVRKITIREQLKESQYADGLKQVNLKETLSKLRHHSSSFRIESLRNLRDAISINHPGLLSSLNDVIQGVSAISLDVEREARRESFKTLSSLLGHLSVEAVAPFFHIISSYLRCAMTHIQPNIQEDALMMLDVLLQHVPHLVAVHSAKIFQNFLEMISRVRADGDKAGRMLTVNMGQRQTTIKWRSKVLLRLQQMLQTLAEHKRSMREDASKANNNNSKFITFSSKTEQHYGVKRVFAPNQICDLSSIFNRSLGSSTLSGEISISDESGQLRSYVEHLMPLLLESWLEVRPQHVSGSGTIETLLTLDAAITLKIVLEIIENLWSLIEIYEQQVNNHDLSIWFKDQYADVFAANFLQDSYPYQQMIYEESDGIAKRKNKKSSTDMLPHCFQQNITVAYLMCRFYSNHLNEQSTRFIAVLKYLTKIVNSISTNNSNDYLRSLVLALRALLLENGSTLLELHKEETKILLRCTIKAFLSNKFSELGIASKILILLCEIVQDSKLCLAYSNEEFCEFLEYLPNLLLKPTISESCLVAMGKLGKQQNAIFLNALRNIMSKVVDHLQTIQVAGAINVFEGKKHIINLFYWLNPQTSINKEVMEKLLSDVETNVTDKRIAGYCQYILTAA
ncbi:testis-expressed protein 10 [Lucilia sericata]|uniref:testis-expressed protein 10 n=1 Tax=Lucilia sericata TaxID=13632 RepID=UPI0018A817D7|nr:testis-expressed protein 10 [Lucilia sericata]